LSIRVTTSQRGDIEVADAHLEIRKRGKSFKVCVIAENVKIGRPIWCLAGPLSTKDQAFREAWKEYAIKPKLSFKTIEQARDYAQRMMTVAPLRETLKLHTGLQEQGPPEPIELVDGSGAELDIFDDAKAVSQVEALILAASTKQEIEALAAMAQDEIDDLDLEGAKTYRLQQIRERSDGNRLRVLQVKGHVCEACGFDFENQFDGLPASAHVHHKSPLALGERQATSFEEFAVLCASCHTAVHMGPGRKLNPRTIEELQRMISTPWLGDVGVKE
jgi:predicted HNH restriction endonuclease